MTYYLMIAYSLSIYIYILYYVYNYFNYLPNIEISYRLIHKTLLLFSFSISYIVSNKLFPLYLNISNQDSSISTIKLKLLFYFFL